MLDAIPTIAGRVGRPRCRPATRHADTSDDYQHCRDACTVRGIIPRIARRGIESSQHLGAHRWVVERTFAWLNRFRRLIIRYERRDNIYLAFATLACALITWNFVQRLCWVL